MIEEATKNALAAANKFATGFLKQTWKNKNCPSQVQFSIRKRDKIPFSLKSRDFNNCVLLSRVN